jgi:hypothetical protein
MSQKLTNICLWLFIFINVKTPGVSFPCATAAEAQTTATVLIPTHSTAPRLDYAKVDTAIET